MLFRGGNGGVPLQSSHDGTGVLGSTAVSTVSQATRLGKGSSVTARDECMP